MTALSREPSERAFRMAALNGKRVSWWSEINRRHREKKYQNMLVRKWIQLVSTCMSTVNKGPQNERRMSEVNLESPWTEVSFKISIAFFTFPTCFFWPWKLTLWEVVTCQCALLEKVFSSSSSSSRVMPWFSHNFQWRAGLALTTTVFIVLLLHTGMACCRLHSRPSVVNKTKSNRT